jgi:hypothetical protein
MAGLLSRGEDNFVILRPRRVAPKQDTYELF